MHSAQPKNDMLPALDVLKEYLGMLGEFPDAQHLVKVCLHSWWVCEGRLYCVVGDVHSGVADMS